MKISSCKTFQYQLDDWLELTAEERRRIESHCQACSACAELLALNRRLFEQVRVSQSAYQGLEYTGPKPELLNQAHVAKQSWWVLLRPLPVALATVTLALGLSFWVSLEEPTLHNGPRLAEAPGMQIVPEAQTVPEVKMDDLTTLPSISVSAPLRVIRTRVQKIERPTAPKKPPTFALKMPSRPSPKLTMRPPKEASSSAQTTPTG